MEGKTEYIRKNILLDWLYKQGIKIEVKELQKFVHENALKKDIQNPKKDN